MTVESKKSVIDTRELRNAFSRFPTGVTIVTTREKNGIPRGFTANSFTSVSLDPPLLLICIDNRAESLPVFLNSTGFAVNILSEQQKETSGLFATQRVDKFDITAWHDGELGVPLIDDAIAWFECEPENQVAAGDHVILIGRIKHFDYRSAQPLGYVAGGYFTLGLEQSIVDAAGKTSGVCIGAVLNNDGAVLLKEDKKTGQLSIPMVGAEKQAQPSLAKLVAELKNNHLDVSIDFLFAVYEDLKNVVCYRGEVSGEPHDGYSFYTLEDVPWNRVAEGPTTSMVRRFVEELKFGNFAVYIGDDVEGKVQALVAHNDD